MDRRYARLWVTGTLVALILLVIVLDVLRR
ncbi:hypothetical protein BJ983_000129 [Actinomycetospora corticicola]|uniref:Uncharacterized protein n=1 Tax=Actinomycetospora corticicola TaxID=663602 RepID=A0A7Y9J3G9_9PSEU|nr:hypothetical protein [Actinomycetospora corticicola]